MRKNPRGPYGRKLWSSLRRYIRKRVLREHGLVCWLCGQAIGSVTEATMDHVTPAAYGGLFEPSNLRPAHRTCNLTRGHGPPQPRKTGEMNKEFAVHMLNDEGKAKAKRIAEAFDRLLDELTTPASPDDPTILCPPGRETAIARTKLEEACFFAKKAMASAPGNT